MRASCPVCGGELDAEPRVCPRCETPHHQDCWDYVPGCALFGCAEAPGAAPVEDWPEAYQLLLARVRARRALARLPYLAVAALVLQSGFAPLGRYFLEILLTSVVVLGAVLAWDAWLGARLARPEFAGLLAEVQAHGDRRLTRAVQERVEPELPVGPLAGTAYTWLALCVMQVLGGLLFGRGELVLDPEVLWALGGMVFQVCVLLVLPFFLLARLGAARQQVLLHRLEAKLEQLEEKKPPAPPGRG